MEPLTRFLIGFMVFIELLLSACQGSEIEQKESQIPMKPQDSSILIIAHRGARSLAPENTLLAAQKAYDLGADMWELDVAMTYDNEMVVIHDDTLTRTSNAAAFFPKMMPWNVRMFTLEELKKLDFGSWFIEKDPYLTIRDGVVSQEDQAKMKNITIPTLEEALVLTKNLGWKVNVEIKDLSKTPGDEIVVEKVVGLIEKLDMVDSVIVSSFKHDYLVQVKKINKNITTAALVEQGVKDPVALVRELGAQAYNPGIDDIGKLSTIQLVRDAGYDVFVWTANNEPTFKKFIDAGVSGIFTDFPQLLIKYLANKKQP
jgi:glycerophosphoryl diester phosphodiesterase